MPRPKRDSGKNPLTKKQYELLNKEKELQRNMAQLQELLEQAPHRAEEMRRREREELLERANISDGHANPFRRIGETSSRHPRGGRRGKVPHRVTLGSERKAERTQFILLLVLLAIVCLIFLSQFSS